MDALVYIIYKFLFRITAVNNDLANTNTVVSTKLDSNKIQFSNSQRMTIGVTNGQIEFRVFMTDSYVMQVIFDYQNGITLRVTTDGGVSWQTYWVLRP